MAENRDSAIKIFGKTIQIPVGVVVSVNMREEFDGDDGKTPSDKETSSEPKDNNEETPTSTTEEKNKEISNNLTNEDKIDPISSPENSKPDDEHNESSNNPQDNSHKKPDKILPCPRCKSMDTKFCYFNNYNINQPRHFCKNCERYWTAGGSMRNVPVGAGRRKSKSLASDQQFRHIKIPDCFQTDPESIHPFQHLRSNGTVLSFGSDAPLCDSMDSIMKLAEKTVKNRNQNIEDQIEQVKVPTNSNSFGFPPMVSNLNGSPWQIPWNHPSFAIPVLPISGYWSMPWLFPPQSNSPNSPNLGKHSREGNLLSHNHSDKGKILTPENCLWVPKTMRIDVSENLQKVQCGQPWDSRMIKPDMISRGGGLFKAFQSSGEQKNHSSEISQALLANPAALSRSFYFQERS